MSASDNESLLLGRQTPAPQVYAPDILYSIPRQLARETLPRAGASVCHGCDVWHAYEMSWLDQGGKPVAFVGKFSLPAQSPNIVESKSFKLYLNSLNSTRFDSVAQAQATIIADISAAAGCAVTLEVLSVDDAALAGIQLQGTCLDDLAVHAAAAVPRQSILQVDEKNVVEDTVYTHLLRSLCPITAQPDWGTFWMHYRGSAIAHHSLLEYIISYRNHQEFHEHCVERMFCDLIAVCDPVFLNVQAFYTRRGGLDINPFRSTDSNAQPLPRLSRQ